MKIGESFGKVALTSDDGSVQQDVLALKVPELVGQLRTDAQNALKMLETSERHNAELLREAEELRAKVSKIGKCSICGEELDPMILESFCDTPSCIRKYANKLERPRPFGNRFRALLCSLGGKGLSAGE